MTQALMSVSNCVLRRKASTLSLNHCISNCAKYFSAFNRIQKICLQVSQKTVLDPNKHSSIKFMKWQSNMPRLGAVNPNLMDFDVWLYPKVSLLLTDIKRLFFELNTYDDDFTVRDFVKSSVTVLHLVSNLLSNLKFEELEGLLTPECKVEVERSLTTKWTKEQAEVLAVSPDVNVSTFPCEILIFPGEENKSRQFVQIRVVYHAPVAYVADFDVLKQYTDYFKNSTLDRPLNAVYNFKFIKEVTKGLKDQWTINGINVLII